MRQREISGTVADGAERRLLWWMIGIALGVNLGIIVAGEGRFAAGFAIGACVAILGYKWLSDVVGSALEAEKVRAVKKLVFKLVVRYPLLLGTLYLFYRTNWLPVWAVLAGLSIPLAGGVAEGLYQVQGMLFSSRTQPGD